MHKQCCYNSVKSGEILVEGTDANASLGIRNRHDNRESLDRDRVMGPHGISYVNAAGSKIVASDTRYERAVRTHELLSKKRVHHMDTSS